MTSIPAALCRISRNNFKRFISKAKDFFWYFYSIAEMCIKFRAFSKKKHEYPSLIFPEIIYAGRRDHLNVWNVLLQNTIR